MIKLFIAIPLPTQIKKQLERQCFGLPTVHWIAHSHFHLTLQYIGPVDELVQLDVKEALTKLQHAPFSLSLQGTGCFEHKKKGVIWTGISPSQELNELKKTVDNLVHPLVPKIDNKAFTPHITLGRFDHIDKIRLADYLDSQSYFTTEPFFIDSFVLMESRKNSINSTIYYELARYKLK
jgi:2'-5' RNA ligase